LEKRKLMLIELQDIISEFDVDIRGVIHLGAHQGEEAHSYAENLIEKVIWVEGNPELIDNLKKILSGYPKHLVFNELISDVDNEKILFKIANNTQASSVFKLKTHKIYHPSVYHDKTISLYAKTLDTIISNNSINIAEYNFLNIDLQGAEGKALNGAKHLLKNSIDCICTEINITKLYDGSILLSQLDEFLKEFNFVRRKVVLTDWGWGDAIYIKEKVMSESMLDQINKNIVEAKKLEESIVKGEKFLFKNRALAFLSAIKNKIFSRK